MAKSELFENRLLRFYLNHLPAIPVRRGFPDRQALSSALRHLGHGWPVAISPEGQRRKTRVPQEAHGGAAFLANKSGVPVIPVGIGYDAGSGSESKVMLRKSVIINIGEPFRISYASGRVERLAAVNVMMNNLAIVVP